MEHRGSNRNHWEIWTALAVYLLLLAASWRSGYEMTVPWGYYQLLSQNALINHLAESLLYLHSQPPLMNLELGLAVKLAQTIGIPYASVILGVHITVGAIAVYGYTRLCQHLVATGWLRAFAIALFVLHPVLYMSLFHFFYTFHEVAILAVLPLAVFAYARTRTTFHYGWICVGVVLLVGTHSLFHLGWGLIVLIGLPLICRGGSENENSVTRSFPAGQVACLAGAAALLFAWPLKNGLLFDSYHASSWGGYNMALELPVDIDRLPARDWDVPERFASIPTLSERKKRNGRPNWNHYSIIQHSRNQGQLALETIAENPSALAQKAMLNYWNYTRFSGRNPYTGKFGISRAHFPEALAPWMNVYESVVYLDPRTRDALAHRAFRVPMRQSWALSGFGIVFPILLIAAAVVVARSWSFAPAESRTALFMLFCVSWVLLVTLLIDGSEANRIRFSTEPYVFLLAFWSLDCLRRKRAGTASGTEPA